VNETVRQTAVSASQF